MLKERQVAQEYKPTIKTRLLLALEDLLIKQVEKQNHPQISRGLPRWVYIAALTFGLPAFAAVGSELVKPGSARAKISEVGKSFGLQAECGPDKPLPYGTSMSIDRKYYLFNNVQGLAVQMDSCAVKNLFESKITKIELPGEEIAIVMLTPQFASENPEAYNEYLRSSISPRIIEHYGKGKEGNFIGINAAKYIAGTYGLGGDSNTSRIKLSESLSLEWALQLKNLTLKTHGNKTSDFLTEQEVNQVLANRPINVVGVTPQLISQSIARYGTPAETKLGKVEAVLQEGSLIVLENEAIYNATPGFVGIIALDLLQEKLRDRTYMSNIPDNTRLVTVLLPASSDNPTEFYKAQAAFKEKKFAEIMAKFPGYTLQVNPIPMGDILKSVYGEFAKGQLKELKYGEVEYDLTKAFFSARKNNGKEVLARAYHEKLFQVLSISDELINNLAQQH